MCLSLTCLWSCMLVTMMAPGLALRGPEGSLVRCLDIVAEEYQSALVYFIAALVFFFASAILWSFSRGTHNAVSVTLIVVFFFACIYYTALRAMLRFDIPRGELVSGGFRQHRSPHPPPAAHERDRAATLPSRYVGADGRAYAPLRDESHDEVPGAAAAAAVRHGMGQLAARLAPIADQQRVNRNVARSADAIRAAWQQATARRGRRGGAPSPAPSPPPRPRPRPPPPPPPPPSCTGRGRRPRRSPPSAITSRDRSPPGRRLRRRRRRGSLHPDALHADLPVTAMAAMPAGGRPPIAAAAASRGRRRRRRRGRRCAARARCRRWQRARSMRQTARSG